MTAKAQEAQSETIALFVSDVHLHESMPRTTQAFLDFLSVQAKETRRLYLLGDLFEYWAGDDDLDTPYLNKIATAIREVSASGVAVFWIGGNRDFLVNRKFAHSTGLTLLDDPHVEELAGIRMVLSHGDAQCTDDLAYMAFRSQVRQPEWQAQFLAQPLATRKAIIEGMRDGSRKAQESKAYEIMDVNPGAILSLFQASGATMMIHGHTHRPATHLIESAGMKMSRHVLPDWDVDSAVPRGGWLALLENGEIKRLDITGKETTAPVLRG